MPALEHAADRPCGARASSAALEAPRLAERVDPRPPERLVGVDVPDPGDRPLVEDRRLDGAVRPRERRPSIARAEARLERLGADALASR